MGTQKTQRLTRWDQLDSVLAKEEAGPRPLRLRSDDEEDIRRAMSSHFRRAGGNDIGGEAGFEAVEEFRVYKVELHSLYERREAARQVLPHDGSPLPPARVTEADLDLWAYTNPPPAAFEEGKQELRIDESREVRQCGACRGQGDAGCTACQGAGAVACGCGDGTAVCPRCVGMGKRRTGTSSEPIPCDCGFTRDLWARDGKVFYCGKCKNSGWQTSNQPVYGKCECGGGRVVCSKCRGTKRVRCGQCGATGKLVCQQCQGSGQQVSYLAVVRSFTPAAASLVVGDGVPKQAVRHMSGSGRFESLAEIDSTEAREKLVPGRGTPSLKRAVSLVIQSSAAKRPTDGRTARQRLTVGVDRVLKVDYTHDEKSYTLWLMGDEMTVLAPESPLTDTLREKVKEAVGLWEEGDQKNAALALRDALDLCEKDADCGAAYEELREDIPRKLQERGKNATTLRRWVRRNPLLVGCLLFVLVPPLLWVCLGIVVTLAQGWGSSRDPAARREWEQRLAEDEKRREAERAREVSVRFASTSHFLDAGKSGKLRVAVRKRAFGDPLDRDIVLKFESPSGLTLPASVKVEKGQMEVDVPVTAGKQTGKFRVKVVPDGLKNTEAFSDTCTVTVTEPLKPPPFPGSGNLPPDVSVQFTMFTLTLEAGKQGKLKLSIDRRNKDKASGDIVLKFVSPASLKLPESVTVEKGQVEAEVPVTAGDRPGKFEVRVVPQGLRNTDYADRATVTVTEARAAAEPRKEPEAKVVAGDFLPHTPGRTRTYLQAAVQGRKVLVSEVEVTQKEGGVTESRVIRTGTLAGNDLKSGKVTWSKVPPPKAVLTVRHRVKDGVVEVGVQGREKDDVAWEPVLKFGKRWTWFTPGGQLKRYELVGFDKHRGRDALVVRSTVTVGEVETVATSTYVKGVGEVERATSVTSGGSSAAVGQLLLVEK